MNDLKIAAASLLGGAAMALLCLHGLQSTAETRATAETPAAAEAATRAPIPPPPPPPEWVDHTIRKGETLSGIFAALGVPTREVIRASSEHTDLSRIRAGRVLGFLMDPDEPDPVAVRYALDEDRTLIVSQEETGWVARVDAIIYETHTGVRRLSVESSLWQAAVDAGLRPRDMASLARVFEYDIDFNTEVRRGDALDVVVEELWTDGELARLGAPLAVRFSNKGRQLTAIRYTRSNGTTGYFDAEGSARKGPFLRSPLEFSRVTSGFSRKRYHPILKKTRAHLGTDFGAPAGTPVRAVGKGKVTMSGRNGGHGNFVKLDHDGPYNSSYSHLSKIHVKRGETVRQGQIIGTVGSTGMSTGPHLHYQFWKSGRIVNPMTVKLPTSERLPGREMSNFRATRDRLLAMLDDAVADASP